MQNYKLNYTVWGLLTSHLVRNVLKHGGLRSRSELAWMRRVLESDMRNKNKKLSTHLIEISDKNIENTATDLETAFARILKLDSASGIDE